MLNHRGARKLVECATWRRVRETDKLGAWVEQSVESSGEMTGRIKVSVGGEYEKKYVLRV